METTTKKRIHYPWLKKSQGRAFKVMLALVAENVGFNNVTEGKISLSKVLRESCKKTNKIFPSMYHSVRKYYKQKGRKINRKDFLTIVYGRIMMMFKQDKESGKVERQQEHPYNTSKLKKYVAECQTVLEKKITWEEYKHSGKDSTPSK